MIVALVGLPGSGKSYFASWFAKRHPSFVVLDKDVVRSTLFPGSLTDYSSEQDDFCITVILQAASYILSHHRNDHVIIDGRTFSRRYQVEQVSEAAGKMGIPVRFVEFVCSDATAKARIEKQRGEHCARNRGLSLYLDLKSHAEPLLVPHLTLSTDGGESLEERERDFLAYLGL